MLWTIARQAPLSVGSTRQEYWSGLPFLPPRDLPNPGIKPRSPALQVDSLPSEPPGESAIPLFPSNPSCLELLTFLILGELSLQSLQLCVDLTLLGLHITETLFQLLGLIPQIILGKE